MSERLFESFKLYYPSFAKKTVEYRTFGPDILIAKLSDGDTIRFDDMEHTFQRIPYSSDNMTEENCRYEFSIRLRRIMVYKAISQAELAEKIGVSQVAISNYLTGKRTPNLYVLDKIAKALDCSLDEFTYRY